VTPELRRTVGQAWAFRASVEHDAAHRFTRLAGAIANFDPSSPAIALMRRAADDERRHAALCEALSAVYGEPWKAAPRLSAEIAPRELEPREAVLYEVVAACCITETESVATLTTLLAEDADQRVRTTLHEIARDEVVHGRMGWAHLAREAARRDVSFLAVWVPVMLSGTIDEGLFAEAMPEFDDSELLQHGVLPQAQKREVFVRTLLDVVFPGLENFGIDAGPARAWLKQRQGERP
jgi:rubrerythrin